jgi:SPP1 family predicted phage head-tail adaptor
MILPGQLRERVTVQQPTRTTTDLGESQLSWSTYATRWASVEGVSSREALQFGQQQVEITHKVRMRYLNGLTSQMRLQWRSRTLDVVSVLEYGNRSEHVLICQEQVA